MSSRLFASVSRSSRSVLATRRISPSISTFLRSPSIPSGSACRCFSVTSRTLNAEREYKISSFTDQEYNKVSNETMETMSEYFEELVESFESPLLDLEYSAGVLTFAIGEKGTYVINKQPPNHQIWLSSPISGPKRFDFDSESKVWFYNRDGTLLSELLNVELRNMLETDQINLDLKLEE